MSKRKPTTQMRSLRPSAESLETRQLLSSTNLTNPTAIARGTDPDGTEWTLRLYGPGALSVVGVNGTVFNGSTQDTDGLDPDDHGRGSDHDTDAVSRHGSRHHWHSEGYVRELECHTNGRAGQD